MRQPVQNHINSWLNCLLIFITKNFRPDAQDHTGRTEGTSQQLSVGNLLSLFGQGFEHVSSVFVSSHILKFKTY